jgi:arylsulfatase A-like enzyme
MTRRAWRIQCSIALARLGAVAIGNIVIDNGYNTAWFGKRHGTR